MNLKYADFAKRILESCKRDLKTVGKVLASASAVV